MRRKSTPRSQRGPKLVQGHNARNSTNSQSGQQSNPSPHPEVQEQRPREQYRARRQRTAEEVVAGEETRSVLRVRQWDVDKDAL